MGRGLSDLQRAILRLAAEQETLTGADVLRHVHGWEPGHYATRRVAGGKYDTAWYPDETPPQEPLSPDHKHFSSRRMDPRQYYAGRGAAHRSIRRLRQRGLLAWEQHGWQRGYGLTDDGWMMLHRIEPEVFSAERVAAVREERAARQREQDERYAEVVRELSHGWRDHRCGPGAASPLASGVSQ